jgi:uncharacterized protein YbjT (DUF2867 family)
MICVTGAGGTVGSEIIKQLESTNTPFRAAYHSHEKADGARERGIDAVTIDYTRTDTLRPAFRGCDTLFLLGPPVLDQTEFELNAVEAAHSAGVPHIVKLSVLGAAEEAYSLAHVHRPVEKAIESIGLAWTFLRPNSFMQNLVTYMGETISAESVFYTASGQARVSHVDVRDVASVAVKALSESEHEGKTYTLTGPEALTYDEVAAELSRLLVRTIKHVSLSTSDLKQAMLEDGVPGELADRMLDLDRYLREGHASIVTADIKQVTGRPPKPFGQYAQETVESGVWNQAAAEVVG